MKAAVFADGDVGFKLLEWLLINFKADVRLVVTVSKNDLYALALQHGICCVVYSNEEVFVETVKGLDLSIELGFLLWWPIILKPSVIALARSGFINTHPSYLPYNRGKNYNFWAIVESAPFGVSLHFVEEGVDSGDIVAQREIPYSWLDTGGTLYCRAQSEMIALFSDAYPSLRNFQYTRIKQDLSQGSFHMAAELQASSKIELDANYQARDLLNLMRARTFEGYPACYFEEQGEEYEVRITISRRYK